MMTKLDGVTRALLLGVGLALAAVPFSALPTAEAKPRQAKNKKDAKDKEADQAEPAELPRAPRLRPKGLRYGMSPKQVAKTYDKAIDDDYRPRMKEVEPGVEMQRLQHEIAMRKQAFRRSLVEFDDKPNNLDATPFLGEFSNNNDEAMMKITRRGRTRYLFFIQKKLWKTIDVYALGDDGKWGPTFSGAIERIQKRLKVEGRALAVDEKAARRYAEVDWADVRTHLRVMDWSSWDKKLAIASVDRRIEGRLDKLRNNKAKKDSGVDSETKKVLR